MTQQVERSANEAVFCLQLGTRDAVRYVARNAKVSDDVAVAAVKQVVVFHRKG